MGLAEGLERAAPEALDVPAVRLDVIADCGGCDPILGEAEAAERFARELVGAQALPPGRAVEGAGGAVGAAAAIDGGLGVATGGLRARTACGPEGGRTARHTPKQT
jgi:hypothetical protein